MKSLEEINNLKRKVAEELSLDELINRLDAFVYIADVETDQIIFMSDNLKEEFGVSRPEGKRCWEVLQSNKGRRCSFCPVNHLLASEDSRPVHVWVEENKITGRTYRHHDTLLTLRDGTRILIECRTDVTEYMELYQISQVDELTGMLNRRSGELMLSQVLMKAEKENVPVSVVLYDINELKRVNDLYGHKEGDRMLKYISGMVKDRIGMQDVALRMGGDEFVLAFYNLDERAAKRWLADILEELRDNRRQHHIFYNISFSFGLVEIYPGEQVSVSDILRRADEKMYEQKRDFHIQKAQSRLEGQEMPSDREIQLCRYEKDSLYRLLSESTDDYVFVGYLQNGTFQYPETMVREFDFPGTVVPNAAAVWSRIIHPDDQALFLESNQEIADGRVERHEIRFRAMNRKGQWVWLRCRGSVARDGYGQPEIFAGTISNLGMWDKKDPETGLLNRYELESRLKDRIQNADVEEQFALILFGLDGFKNINDLYDRRFGDEVLKNVGNKIKFILPRDAEIFRIEGDNFAVLLENGDKAAAGDLFEEMQAIFRKRQELFGNRYYVSFSGGCAAYPEDGKRASSLLKNARYAMGYAKQKERGKLCRFSHDILAYRQHDLELLELLRECVERNFLGFYICYQPQFDMRTGQVIGAEALLRWYMEEKGSVSPAEAVPILEKSGLIIPVGRWFLKKVIEDCKRWSGMRKDFRVNVNLSYLQFFEDNMPQAMSELLEEYDLEPKYMGIELTEGSLMRGRESILEDVRTMRAMGINFAMDNFGSGGSTLQNLKDIPVDMVKIDRVFLKGITENHFDAMLLHMIVELCHNMGWKVCIEGVETEQEYEFMKQSNLDYAQGFHTGRPVEKDKFETLYLYN